MEPNTIPQPYGLLIAAVFSKYPDSFLWFEDRATKSWGNIVQRSREFSFEQTRYYETEMGSGLKKRFYAFEISIPLEDLVRFKLESILWEKEYAELRIYPESRPINLDPGYLTLQKLVLASTKDRAHRIYLSQGVYGEVTMTHVRGWVPYPWTYPDYLLPDNLDFFSNCRESLRHRKS